MPTQNITREQFGAAVTAYCYATSAGEKTAPLETIRAFVRAETLAFMEQQGVEPDEDKVAYAIDVRLNAMWPLDFPAPEKPAE